MSDVKFPKLHLMVIGNARHGKDSVCEILRDKYGLTFESSSHFVAKIAVRPWLENLGIFYKDFDEMYADRMNHRAHWYNAISDYNTPDLTRLGRELFERYDIYGGIRRYDELEALKAKGVVQYTIWVDAIERLPVEDSSSITVTRDQADFIIDNNGPLEALAGQVRRAYMAAVEKNIDTLNLDWPAFLGVMSAA